MAARIFRLLAADSKISMQIRHKYTRGKDPTIARNLQERITALEYKDPTIYYKNNIGFALEKKLDPKINESWMKERKTRQRSAKLKKEANAGKLQIDLEQAEKDWLRTNATQHIHKTADHFGIYDDLFGDAYFYPVNPLTIDYDFGHEELLARVYRGNLILPHQAQNAPSVSYHSDDKSLWTLLLTTPDGNFSDPEYEYCHWFIGNIPGNDISKGETIIDYLRPIPAKGIGFCRYVFVLYKQDKKIDLTEYKKEQPCLNLVDRNWKTYDFMRKHQDYVTPAGLAFFQSEYDTTLKDFYHNTLEMQEPTFEYDFPEPYIKPQVWFPIKEAFNLYLDRYRDIKQINKEYLLKKLKKEHPFKYPEPPLKYPNAHPIKEYMPSWLTQEYRNERMGWGRYNDYNDRANDYRNI